MSETTEGAVPYGEAPDVEVSPAPDTEAQTSATAAGDTDEAETDTDEAEPVEELEFDFGGNKFKVPKGAIPEDVAAELDKFTKGTWRDYTQKSQAVAEAAKAIAAEREVVTKLRAMSEETQQAYATGLQIQADIERLSQVDLNALWQSDPDRARRVSDVLAQKQAEFSRTVNRVSELAAASDQAEQQFVASRMDEGRARVAKAIKGFDASAEAKLIDYAVKVHGISERDAKQWALNPAGTVMAWESMQYRALMAKSQAAAKPSTPPAPTAPVASLKGRSVTAGTDPDKMTDEQWVKWRNADIARQRQGARR
jgi:hypothetical protein